MTDDSPAVYELDAEADEYAYDNKLPHAPNTSATATKAITLLHVFISDIFFYSFIFFSTKVTIKNVRLKIFSLTFLSIFFCPSAGCGFFSENFLT